LKGFRALLRGGGGGNLGGRRAEVLPDPCTAPTRNPRAAPSNNPAPRRAFIPRAKDPVRRRPERFPGGAHSAREHAAHTPRNRRIHPPAAHQINPGRQPEINPAIDAQPLSALCAGGLSLCVRCGRRFWRGFVWVRGLSAFLRSVCLCVLSAFLQCLSSPLPGPCVYGYLLCPRFCIVGPAFSRLVARMCSVRSFAVWAALP